MINNDRHPSLSHFKMKQLKLYTPCLTNLSLSQHSAPSQENITIYLKSASYSFYEQRWLSKLYEHSRCSINVPIEHNGLLVFLGTFFTS